MAYYVLHQGGGINEPQYPVTKDQSIDNVLLVVAIGVHRHETDTLARQGQVL